MHVQRVACLSALLRIFLLGSPNLLPVRDDRARLWHSRAILTRESHYFSRPRSRFCPLTLSFIIGTIPPVFSILPAPPCRTREETWERIVCTSAVPARHARLVELKERQIDVNRELKRGSISELRGSWKLKDYSRDRDYSSRITFAFLACCFAIGARLIKTRAFRAYMPSDAPRFYDLRAIYRRFAGELHPSWDRSIKNKRDQSGFIINRRFPPGGSRNELSRRCFHQRARQRARSRSSRDARLELS